jgi:hypothetical protein
MGRGVSTTFPVSGNYRHVVDKAVGGDHMRRIRSSLRRKMLEGVGNFHCLHFATECFPYTSSFSFTPHCATVPRARTDKGRPSHDQNQKINIRRLHDLNRIPPLALPLDPILGVPGRESDSSDVGSGGGSGVASLATSADA